MDQDDKKNGQVVVAVQPEPPSGSSNDPAPDLVILVSGDGSQKCINVGGNCDSYSGGSRSGRVRWRQLK